MVWLGACSKQERTMKLNPIAIAALITSIIGLSAFDGYSAQVINSSKVILSQTDMPSVTPQQAIARILNSRKLKAEWFAPDFLVKVPLPKMEEIIANMQIAVGKCQQIQDQDVSYLAICDRGNIPVKIKLNSEGKVTAIFFAKHQQTFEQAVSSFKELEGDVSLLVMEGKNQRAGIRADDPMAVGSAFKLAVLKALKNQIADGKITWGQVVSLQAKQQSFPTGILQDWSAGSLLTVQTLASLMISISDNTATDALIDLVGKKEVERFTLRNRPFLKTREMFTLRGSKNAELLKKYRLANISDRLQILKTISSQELPDILEFVKSPKISLDIEWIFTVRELCSLIEDVADLPLMSFNSGLADPTEWKKVSFKGGSDAGVLNFTTLLQSKNGKSYCVSTTWNHTSPVSEAKLATLYKGLIDTLSQ